MMKKDQIYYSLWSFNSKVVTTKDYKTIINYYCINVYVEKP